MIDWLITEVSSLLFYESEVHGLKVHVMVK